MEPWKSSMKTDLMTPGSAYAGIAGATARAIRRPRAMTRTRRMAPFPFHSGRQLACWWPPRQLPSPNNRLICSASNLDGWGGDRGFDWETLCLRGPIEKKRDERSEDPHRELGRRVRAVHPRSMLRHAAGQILQ